MPYLLKAFFIGFSVRGITFIFSLRNRRRCFIVFNSTFNHPQKHHEIFIITNTNAGLLLWHG
jgi:hypothetical protein